MKTLFFIIIAMSLVMGVSAQRYVPYDSVQQYFNEKYQPVLAQQEQAVPPPPLSYIDPESRQLYSYRPYAVGGRMTATSYYRMDVDGATISIVEGSYEDGYNRGYFSGYEDGIAFQKTGYEGYFDYLEAHKAKKDVTREGYYQMSDAQVKITVKQSENEYDNGYYAGIAQGFKDGFYDVKYQGKNRDTYAYQVMLEQYPGAYVPVPSALRFRNTYRTFPSYTQSWTGNTFYGFNYY
jgi:hypothetical protein